MANKKQKHTHGGVFLVFEWRRACGHQKCDMRRIFHVRWVLLAGGDGCAGNGGRGERFGEGGRL